MNLGSDPELQNPIREGATWTIRKDIGSRMKRMASESCSTELLPRMWAALGQFGLPRSWVLVLLRRKKVMLPYCTGQGDE